MFRKRGPCHAVVELHEQHLFPGSREVGLGVVKPSNHGTEGREFLACRQRRFRSPVVLFDFRHGRVTAHRVMLKIVGHHREIVGAVREPLDFVK